MEKDRKFEIIDEISGAWVRSIPRFKDPRGQFMENSVFNEFKIFDIGFKQSSFSYSNPMVFRGFHLQLDQWQLITLVQGRIIDYLVDLDQNSKTYTNSVALEIDSDGVNQILIAPTVAHGYSVGETGSIIHYMHSTIYQPALQFGFSMRDPVVGNLIKDEFNNYTISERDLGLGTFTEAANQISEYRQVDKK